MAQKNEKNPKPSKQFNQEFAQPLDEHSVEERERAQRTGDNADSSNNKDHKQDNEQNRNNDWK
ncbi:hypothetical protein [Sporolactobacillus laevolacticus]|uniref:Uncharacterized protein n=1 Tax=Sporolactobacillus laevolacticus DSM 442 TaxID=1395513 RepID=V6J6S8_9BACL|nr:hypothetical protein [Sporolactobacillus laevolacticus]EST12479.1 hypothetical protein P343_06885 [Sporolactobacillus laevolacticus DSM 442]MDN3955310.1 hypothetical protein [Sporolactobacillus laevolacticus]